MYLLHVSQPQVNWAKKTPNENKTNEKKPKIIMENIEKLETRNVENERIEKEP